MTITPTTTPTITPIPTPNGALALRREQVTWLGTHRMPPRVTYPVQWIVTEPDGYQRFFDTRAEAMGWVDGYLADHGGDAERARA